MELQVPGRLEVVLVLEIQRVGLLVRGPLRKGDETVPRLDVLKLFLRGA